jgi:hypothetical protein
MEHPPSPFKTQLAREFFKLFSRCLDCVSEPFLDESSNVLARIVLIPGMRLELLAAALRLFRPSLVRARSRLCLPAKCFAMCR